MKFTQYIFNRRLLHLNFYFALINPLVQKLCLMKKLDKDSLCPRRTRSGLIHDSLWRVYLPHKTPEMFYPWSVFKSQKTSVGMLIHLCALSQTSARQAGDRSPCHLIINYLCPRTYCVRNWFTNFLLSSHKYFAP